MYNSLNGGNLKKIISFFELSFFTKSTIGKHSYQEKFPEYAPDSYFILF